MSNNEQSLVEKLISEDDGKRRFLQARALRKASTLIEDAMAENEISRSVLASRLGKTRGWVTQLLAGQQNMTIRTVADALAVMDMEMRISSVPIQVGKSSRRILKLSEKTEARWMNKGREEEWRKSFVPTSTPHSMRIVSG